MKKPKWRWRVFLTLALVAIYWIVDAIYFTGQGPIEGSIALGQLNGGDAEYAASRALTETHKIPTIIGWVVAVIVFVVWGTYLLGMFRHLTNATQEASQ